MEGQLKFVVGLGASAGGLEALERFFDHAPTDSGGAFLVVMHLSRNFKSMLDELLARHTSMAVLPAVDGETIQPNTVYVIQAATTLEVDGASLKVSTRPMIAANGPATTIDQLFHSIAEGWGERAGGVVLSGSGSDGAQGLRAIHDAGGFACAQAPETAKFDSMPVSAIGANAVRAVEAPEQLATTVVEGILLPQLRSPMPVVADDDAALAKILRAVVGVSHLDASKYKHSTFERRVRRRMLELDIAEAEAYADKIVGDPAEARRLADSLLIGVTEFFRDREAFKILRDQVAPELIRRAQAEDRPIRIWSAGCATGEEPYSIAMVLAKAMDDIPHRVDVQIFATDVKRDFLSEAGRGVYDEARLAGAPDDLRRRFFTRQPGESTWVVSPELRKMIVFAPHDVLADPPFTRLDMISCRNLLIYFSVEAQQKILSNFAFGLSEKGFLFLGSSETVGARREAFEFVDARQRVFRRTGAREASPSLRLMREGAPPPPPRQAVRMRETALQPAYSALLREYAPPSLLVSDERELLHTFGDARAYLQPPAGVAHLDAAEMIDPALKTPLVAGVERALNDRRTIRFSRLTLEMGASPGAQVNMILKPLIETADARPRYALVIIEDVARTVVEERDVATVIGAEAFSEVRIGELEGELERTREALQSTIEEIETTNEELQASNEELMASNEELQSTNEELSSVNEELYSVNAEYHRQNDELVRLSADFDLLLRSTEVGVVFLDNSLNITRFTTLAGELFNLAEADVGRPIDTFRSPFVGFDPAAALRASLKSTTIVEAEIEDADGVSWLARAASYPNRPGAVLTLINIGRLRDAEIEARRNAKMLEAVRHMTKAFHIEIDADLGAVAAELGFQSFIGQSFERASARRYLRAVHPDDRRRLVEFLKDAAGDAGAAYETVIRVVRGGWGGHRHVRLTAERAATTRPVSNGAAALQVTGIDVDDFVRSQIETRDRDEILDAVLRAAPSLASFIDCDERHRYANPAHVKALAGDDESLIGRSLREVLPPSVYKAAEPRYRAALAGERSEFMIEDMSVHGEITRLAVTLEPVRDKSGAVMGFAQNIRDVTKYYAYAADLAADDRALANAARLAHYGVVIVDVETTQTTFANGGAKERLGLRRDLALPAGVKIARLTPEWTDRAWSEWLTGVNPGEDAVRQDVIVFDAAQKTVRADLYAAVVVEVERRLAVVRVFENSERLAALEDLRRRSRQLAISNRDLEQFASVVAHDLRAPLRHINQFSEFLRSEVGAATLGEAGEHLRMIEESADAMSEMIEALLDYARLDRAARNFQTLDLRHCAERAVRLIGDETLQVEWRLDAPPPIVGDETLIVRLFLNLIGNAVKYAAPEIGPAVRIEAYEAGMSAVIAVSDKGIGVKPAHAEKIFKLFQRLHTEDEYPGLGVGLATCRRICELHGGGIELDKSYEGGARFIVTLPTAVRDEEEASPPYAAQ